MLLARIKVCHQSRCNCDHPQASLYSQTSPPCLRAHRCKCRKVERRRCWAQPTPGPPSQRGPKVQAPGCGVCTTRAALDTAQQQRKRLGHSGAFRLRFSCGSPWPLAGGWVHEVHWVQALPGSLWWIDCGLPGTPLCTCACWSQWNTPTRTAGNRARGKAAGGGGTVCSSDFQLSGHAQPPRWCVVSLSTPWLDLPAERTRAEVRRRSLSQTWLRWRASLHPSHLPSGPSRA